jgi:hypothetical protein
MTATMRLPLLPLLEPASARSTPLPGCSDTFNNYQTASKTESSSEPEIPRSDTIHEGPSESIWLPLLPPLEPGSVRSTLLPGSSNISNNFLTTSKAKIPSEPEIPRVDMIPEGPSEDMWLPLLPLLEPGSARSTLLPSFSDDFNDFQIARNVGTSVEAKSPRTDTTCESSGETMWQPLLPLLAPDSAQSTPMRVFSDAFNVGQVPSEAKMSSELDCARTDTPCESLMEEDDMTQELPSTTWKFWDTHEDNDETDESRYTDEEFQREVCVIDERSQQVQESEPEVEELRKINRELERKVFELNAMVTQYEMDLEKAKDEVRVYDARIETLHYRAQDLQSDLLRRRSDLNEITSDKILKRFEALCYYIDEWVASQVPWEDVPEPMFVDNGDLNLADLLKDDDHIGEEIITTLVHQCLQREFFGDHIYLVGLPEDYTDFYRQSNPAWLSQGSSNEHEVGQR